MKKLLVLFFLMLTSLSSPAHADLYYQTYAGSGPTPCLGCGTPLTSGTVTSVNFDWGSGQVLNSGRAEQVVVRFWGFFNVPGTETRTVTFYNISDDGFILRINGVTVINDWAEQGPMAYNGAGSITLQGGQSYQIEVWYYENGGGAAAQLYWNYFGGINLVDAAYYTLSQPVNPKAFGDGGQSLPATSISASQSTKIASTNNISAASVYIESYGSGVAVNVDQRTTYNSVNLYSVGNSNSYTIVQGTPGILIGRNSTSINVNGTGNTLNFLQQANNKYAEAVITGAANSITLQQKDSVGKSAFINVSGSTNNISVLQQGSANHFFSTSIPTNGNTVSVTQSGAAQKLFSLTINSPNVGVTVTQTGALADSAAMSITCNTGPCTGYTYVKN
jgi:hypothetical protein